MKKWIFIILFLGLIFGLFNFVSAQKSPVNLYFFYGSTCPNCKKAEKFLEGLEEKYPELRIKSYEVFGNKENAELLLKLFEECGEEKQVRVPAIFIGGEVIIGYLSDETTGPQIETEINQCLEKPCPDPLERIEECEVCGCQGEKCGCEVCECESKED